MSATNKTTNFELPLFIGSDRPAWLSDWNQAMTKIDTNLQQIKLTANEADSTAGGFDSKITALQQQVSSMQSQVNDAVSASQAADTAIKNWKTVTSIAPSNVFNADFSTITMMYNKSLGLLYMTGLLTFINPTVMQDHFVLGTFQGEVLPGATRGWRNIGMAVSVQNQKNFGLRANFNPNGVLEVVSPYWDYDPSTGFAAQQIYIDHFVSMAGAGNGWPAFQ